MWIGTLVGRILAPAFGGERGGYACGDPQARLWWVRRMVPRWAAAQAWGNVILVRRIYRNHPHVGALIAHEYRHVLQWRRYRSLFVGLYVVAYFGAWRRHGRRNAYWMNRFEREARGEEV